MSIIDFTQRRKQQLLEETAQEEHEEGTVIEIGLTPSHVSAINFIAQYQGTSAETIEEAYSSFFRDVQITTHALHNKGLFKPRKTFLWQNFNQTTKQAYTQRIVAQNQTTYDNILASHPNRDLDINTIQTIATNNYIQKFLDFFNEKVHNIVFRQKKDVLREALKDGNEGLSKIICEQTRTRYHMTFIDANNLNDMRVAFYEHIRA